MILPRQYGYNNCYYDRFNNRVCRNSTWNNWARWLVLGLVIFGAILIFFLFSCVTARRRRKRGYQPYRGTGWTLGRTPPGHGQATYNNQPQYAQYAQNQNQYQAPQTQQPYYNNSNNPPPSYYDASANRGGNNDVELQSPQPAYGGQGSHYQPPKGPPPNNHY